MPAKSLYSLHNQLTSDDDSEARLEINPAVVVAGAERRFGLSAVCVGPRLTGAGAAVAMELDCDGERVELEALDQRAESSEDGSCLTVALFAVSAELLCRLASAAAVRVRFGQGERRLERSLSPENRDNVDRFLRHPDIAVAPVGGSGAVESMAV